jgi:hypothetical protein
MLTLAVPAATARPLVDSPSGYPRPLAGWQPPAAGPVAVQPIDDGFDLGSAGVGAAATAGLVLLALGGTRLAAHAGAGHVHLRRLS